MATSCRGQGPGPRVRGGPGGVQCIHSQGPLGLACGLPLVHPALTCPLCCWSQGTGFYPRGTPPNGVGMSAVPPGTIPLSNSHPQAAGGASSGLPTEGRIWGPGPAPQSWEKVALNWCPWVRGCGHQGWPHPAPMIGWTQHTHLPIGTDESRAQAVPAAPGVLRLPHQVGGGAVSGPSSCSPDLGMEGSRRAFSPAHHRQASRPHLRPPRIQTAHHSPSPPGQPLG